MWKMNNKRVISSDSLLQRQPAGLYRTKYDNVYHPQKILEEGWHKQTSKKCISSSLSTLVTTFTCEHISHLHPNPTIVRLML